MNPSFSEIFSKQQGRGTPATFKKGIINYFYADLGIADVQLIGSVQTILKNVPFSSAIDLSDVQVGDLCRVDMFDESNPKDSVIAYTYGRIKRKRFNSGKIASVPAGTCYPIPHGLGIKPDIYGIINPISMNVTDCQVYECQDADNTNIYIFRSSACGDLSGWGYCKWFAAILPK